jgi:hypothetical protein
MGKKDNQVSCAAPESKKLAVGLVGQYRRHEGGEGKDAE